MITCFLNEKDSNRIYIYLVESIILQISMNFVSQSAQSLLISYTFLIIKQ